MIIGGYNSKHSSASQISVQPGLRWQSPSRWCALQAAVCKSVRVRSWQLPGGHVAGNQCSRVTDGAACPGGLASDIAGVMRAAVRHMPGNGNKLA